MLGRTRIPGVVLGLIAVAAILAGCSGSPASPPTASPAPTSPPTAAPSATPKTLTLVSFSDSVFGNGDDGNVMAVDMFAGWMRRDLGVDVTVHGEWYGGYTSDEVLDYVKTDQELQLWLRKADVIVFEVPVGELRFVCPFDNTTWMPVVDVPGWNDCAPKVVARNSVNAQGIADELVKLRDPSTVLIRAVNLWEFGYAADIQMGIEPAMRQIFVGANAGLKTAADSHGIQVADAWAAFMGPDGKTDPVAAGDLLDDGRHLTPQGAAKLALVLRAMGYGKLGAAPAG